MKGEARLPHLSDEFGTLDKVWGGWGESGRIRRRGGHTVGDWNWSLGSMWPRKGAGAGKDQRVKCAAGLHVGTAAGDK